MKKDTKASKKLKQERKDYIKTLITFKQPPGNFNPLKASERELNLYGFPRKPDQKKEGKYFELWQKALSQPLHYIRPEFKIDKTRITTNSKPGKGKKDVAKYGFADWAGALTLIEAYGFSEPLKSVHAELVVPHVYPDPANMKKFRKVGFWVGIDDDSTTQLLQAGVAASIVGEKTEYWAWFEWYPEKPVRFTNFPVKPGQRINMLICETAKGDGYVSILNKATGAVTSVIIPKPAGVTSLNGKRAMWIAEKTSDSDGLPDFNYAVFTDCKAGTPSHVINLAIPIITDIQGVHGTGLNHADTYTDTLQRGDSVMIFWKGYD